MLRTEHNISTFVRKNGSYKNSTMHKGKTLFSKFFNMNTPIYILYIYIFFSGTIYPAPAPTNGGVRLPAPEDGGAAPPLPLLAPSPRTPETFVPRPLQGTYSRTNEKQNRGQYIWFTVYLVFLIRQPYFRTRLTDGWMDGRTDKHT